MAQDASTWYTCWGVTSASNSKFFFCQQMSSFWQRRWNAVTLSECLDVEPYLSWWQLSFCNGHLTRFYVFSWVWAIAIQYMFTCFRDIRPHCFQFMDWLWPSITYIFKSFRKLWFFFSLITFGQWPDGNQSYWHYGVNWTASLPEMVGFCKIYLNILLWYMHWIMKYDFVYIGYLYEKLCACACIYEFWFYLCTVFVHIIF